MKILAVALADEAQRFVPGYPPKGAWLFLRPDIEISRLASLCVSDQFIYLDERVEKIEASPDFDLVLARCNFGQEETARWMVEEFARVKQPVILFGPAVTAWGTNPPPWVTNRVIGDITSVFAEIRTDALHHQLKPLYQAPFQPNYVVPKYGLGKRPVMNTLYQTAQFVRGCACPESLRHLCPEYLYYRENTRLRRKDEVIGEILSLPGKQIHLLDEDITRFPEYYYDLFKILWNYRRHWSVNAGDTLFRYPDFIRLLAKAGTKIIYLNDTFLTARLKAALVSPKLTKQLYHRVKFLQSRRILVGVRLTLTIDEKKFNAIATLLSRIDLDFVEVRFTTDGPDGKKHLVPLTYHPLLKPEDPAWVKNRFYALSALIDRFIRRPRRVGFYSTAAYLIPYSLAYRQNFLEGLPYP
ncbi:hypothetical protein HPY86_00225 [candidate division WOR-3 bacterium]|nr:hypothetical protein [candidate division WOR-3 bacterium]